MADALPIEDYIITVGPGGTFRKSDGVRTKPSDIDALFTRLKTGNTKKIALYFHGGLVSQTEGIKTARHVSPYITGAGIEPICFVWETGLIETIGSNISKISETVIFSKVVKLLLFHLSGHLPLDFADAVGRSGRTLTEEQITQELSKPNPFGGFKDTLAAGVTSRSANSSGRPLPPDFTLEATFARSIDKDKELKQSIAKAHLSQPEREGARGIYTAITFAKSLVAISHRVINRFMSNRDHGTYPTIVEEVLRQFYIAEVGAWVWSSMKEKAQIMWTGTQGQQQDEQYVGRYFLDKLAQYSAEQDGLTIDLIGHSAGSIAICHLMEAVRKKANEMSFNKIVFMAPACRIELFRDLVLSHPESYKAIRIYTMADKHECEDLLVPYFYTRSLLYLISGILEDGGDAYDAYILGLERHLRFESPYDIAELSDIHQYLYEPQLSRMVYSKTLDQVQQGLHSHSLKHGDFDDDDKTMTSIQYFIKQ
ncbi:hypothetical protein [uncultured Flavobacterium sp.]|uniref:hypothetical protein n=1 Tax=uncultured Flavobacterium sp. TaxID=165435 RepID=UPI0025FBB2EE|nr:hypothetical protein [uncultured Flavobacterium sp.]